MLSSFKRGSIFRPRVVEGDSVESWVMFLRCRVTGRFSFAERPESLLARTRRRQRVMNVVSDASHPVEERKRGGPDARLLSVPLEVAVIDRLASLGPG